MTTKTAEEKIIEYGHQLAGEHVTLTVDLLLVSHKAWREEALNYQAAEKANASNATTIEQKIIDYGHTMVGDHFTLSIDMLIESHRTLREEAQKTQAERKEAIRLAVERATVDARIYALSHDFLSREELRGMTVAKLVKVLHEEDD